ncbi:MAG: class B sortase [Raoultibacter sp.]
MVNRRTKMKLGIVVLMAAILILAAAFAGIFYFQSKTHFSPSPSRAVEYKDGYPNIDWTYWTAQNPDIIGWITIPHTHVDAPIVQAKANNPQFYLSHDAWGNWNPWGAIYVSAECVDEGLDSQNTVIYGHNMGNGDTQQFGDLSRYTDYTFANEHATILIQTPAWNKTMQVEFVEIARGWDPVRQTTFSDELDFSSWYAERARAASVTLADTTEPPSQVFSLVTCSYNYWSSERTIVYAC